MSNHETKKTFSTDQYEKRLIIFIDVIGFKNFILSNYKNGEEEVIKEFTYFFQQKVSEGGEFIRKDDHVFQPTFNFFSDSIVITYPLNCFAGVIKVEFSELDSDDKRDAERFLLLNCAITSVTSMQLHALKFDLLTRGCVTIGDIYHKKNTWYGPGLIEAYTHESKIAIYPRVILSKNCFEYFGNELVLGEGDLMQDTDGYFYINYIKWLNIKTEFGSDFCKAHHQLREIIVRNIKVLGAQGKVYELQKWEWLALYFNSHKKRRLETNPDEKLSSDIIV
ncbi:hypothetical protein H206_01971 [Candidatus Electrothrix aarhusensis]|uniref:Guanylate cyclase domain-containing protein n=1 Tax=Candidatus Electrothrix aarhusensis TaxID=1859131 RepID=A0A3S3RNT2_9BACT|nr:hypothetical protein H206_01971 [Candidatus Electrothrix aarhusensis]